MDEVVENSGKLAVTAVELDIVYVMEAGAV